MARSPRILLAVVSLIVGALVASEAAPFLSHPTAPHDGYGPPPAPHYFSIHTHGRSGFDR